MTDVPYTNVEKKYLRLATRKELLDKSIAELSSPFAVEPSEGMREKYNHYLKQDLAQRDDIVRQMKELEPQFKKDQLRRHLLELDQTNYGQSLTTAKAADKSPKPEPSLVAVPAKRKPRGPQR